MEKKCRRKLLRHRCDNQSWAAFAAREDDMTTESTSSTMDRGYRVTLTRFSAGTPDGHGGARRSDGTRMEIGRVDTACVDVDACLYGEEMDMAAARAEQHVTALLALESAAVPEYP